MFPHKTKSWFQNGERKIKFSGYTILPKSKELQLFSASSAGVGWQGSRVYPAFTNSDRDSLWEPRGPNRLRKCMKVQDKNPCSHICYIFLSFYRVPENATCSKLSHWSVDVATPRLTPKSYHKTSDCYIDLKLKLDTSAMWIASGVNASLQ